jgi:hypothetical protein
MGDVQTLVGAVAQVVGEMGVLQHTPEPVLSLNDMTSALLPAVPHSIVSQGLLVGVQHSSVLFPTRV